MPGVFHCLRNYFYSGPRVVNRPILTNLEDIPEGPGYTLLCIETSGTVAGAVGGGLGGAILNLDPVGLLQAGAIGGSIMAIPYSYLTSYCCSNRTPEDLGETPTFLKYLEVWLNSIIFSGLSSVGHVILAKVGGWTFFTFASNLVGGSVSPVLCLVGGSCYFCCVHAPLESRNSIPPRTFLRLDTPMTFSRAYDDVWGVNYCIWHNCFGKFETAAERMAAQENDPEILRRTEEYMGPLRAIMQNYGSLAQEPTGAQMDRDDSGDVASTTSTDSPTAVPPPPPSIMTIDL